MSTFEAADPDRRSGRWFENTPWWLVSMGIHAVVLLSAALIYVERLMASEDVNIQIGVREARPMIPLVDKHDVFTSNGGVKIDEETDKEPLEQSILNPLAKKSDHDETDDKKATRSMWGQSKEFLSWKPG